MELDIKVFVGSNGEHYALYINNALWIESETLTGEQVLEMLYGIDEPFEIINYESFLIDNDVECIEFPEVLTEEFFE